MVVSINDGLSKTIRHYYKFLMFALVFLSLLFSSFQIQSEAIVNAASLGLPPETLYAGTDTGLQYDDEVSSYFNIGFDFTFYGNTYTTFAATTNGLIGFDGGPTYTYTNAAIPSLSNPNNSIYAFWDDLYPREANADVLYRTIGEAPNRELIVQWTNYGYYSYPDLPMGTFQIILYEASVGESNQFRMQYRQLLTDPYSFGSSATIGVENAGGTAAVQYSYNTESLDPEQSILWTWNGTTYTYDDGAAYEGVYLYKDNPPPGVPTLIAPANGSAGVSTSPTFSWNAASNATSYNLFVSTNANLSSPVINQSGLTATSYAGSGLSVGPTYYWAVEAVNAYGNSFSSVWNFTTAAGNSAPNDISLSNNSISDGLPADTEVGTLSTTDPDVGDTFTYTLVTGAGSSDNASFTISGNSLRTNASLSAGDYTIRMRSTDQGSLFVEEIFSISVTGGDTTPPTVTIDQGSSQADPTNASPITYDVVFSESVTGFGSTDVNIAGMAGTPSITVTGSGTTYTVEVSGMADVETITATIPSGAAQDGSGNPNIASTSTDNSVSYDIGSPTETIEQGSSQADPTNSSPIVFDVTFSEPVTGFAAGDVNITGIAGTPVVLVSGSDAAYTVSVSGMADGETVTAAIGSGAAQDLAGNSSEASTSTDNSVSFDTTQPTVTINQGSSQADPANVEPITFDVEFSESVSAFTQDDLVISGMSSTPTVSVTGSGASYTVEITGLTDGDIVTVEVSADAAVDAAGNSSLASTSTDNSVTYDVSPPTVTIDQGSSQADPTNTSPIVFDVVFSEPVTCFADDDVVITGIAGSPTVSVGGSGSTYTVEVAGMVDGETVTATVAANAAQDSAGNLTQASTSTDNSVTYDVTNPTVTIDQGASQADPTNTDPIVFDVVFSEHVLGFDFNDVAVTGMTSLPTIMVNGSGAVYTVEVSGMADGETISAEVVESAALDLAGNPSFASTSTDNAVLYDITPIEVSLDAGVIGNPGNLVILENGQYLTRFTEITVEFDSDAYDPQGNTEPDDVTNPINYYLLRPGANYVFNVSTCGQIALLGTSTEWDDILVPITAVAYDNNNGNGPFIVSLTVNRLQLDKYRLILCGSTSIVDLAMNPLNSGEDVTIDFSIVAYPDELPNTGFPMGVETVLPKQDAGSTYNSTGMFLSLPTLGMSTQIIGVPLESDGWNTVWLGNYAGFLGGSAFPSWAGNTVITGHVWTATNEPGIFVDLDKLTYGDEVQIYAWGRVYTYAVRSSRIVSDSNVASVMRSEVQDWLTLVTCDTYDPETGTFIYRRVVRAVLVGVE